MAKDNWTATAASTQIVSADNYREVLTIQKTNATAVAIGIGEAAIAGKGIQLVNVNDVLVLRGAAARKAIYAIGNGGTGTYQDGDIQFTAGPHVAA